MNHDPMCPSLGHGALPLIDLCRCGLIARIRDDERGESGDFCKGWDEGWLAGHDAALRNAMNAIKALGPLSQYRKELGDDGHPIFWCEPVDAVAAVEALGGER